MGSGAGSQAEVLLDINEAQRRCLKAGYSLAMEARCLTSFPANDRRPLWQAFYLDQVRRERLSVNPPAIGME
jgi:hypothetical protein